LNAWRSCVASGPDHDRPFLALEQIGELRLLGGDVSRYLLLEIEVDALDL